MVGIGKLRRERALLIEALRDWLNCYDSPDEWMRCRDKARRLLKQIDSKEKHNDDSKQKDSGRGE